MMSNDLFLDEINLCAFLLAGIAKHAEIIIYTSMHRDLHQSLESFQWTTKFTMKKVGPRLLIVRLRKGTNHLFLLFAPFNCKIDLVVQRSTRSDVKTPKKRKCSGQPWIRIIDERENEEEAEKMTKEIYVEQSLHCLCSPFLIYRNWPVVLCLLYIGQCISKRPLVTVTDSTLKCCCVALVSCKFPEYSWEIINLIEEKKILDPRIDSPLTSLKSVKNRHFFSRAAKNCAVVVITYPW